MAAAAIQHQNGILVAGGMVVERVRSALLYFRGALECNICKVV